MSIGILFLLFIFEITCLLFVSRISIQSLFRLLFGFFHNEKVVFSIISILFLPGTIVHELSHFLMAIVLLLKVRSFTVFPEWEDNSIKLGSVVYEKKDFVRGILVGIAPILIGLILFWIISIVHPFSQESILLKILMVYVIFVLSSTMFSSKQDLIDMVYLIPLILIIVAIVYIFQIDIFGMLEKFVFKIQGLENFLYAIITYIGIALGIHILFIGLSKLFHKST